MASFVSTRFRFTLRPEVSRRNESGVLICVPLCSGHRWDIRLWFVKAGDVRRTEGKEKGSERRPLYIRASVRPKLPLPSSLCASWQPGGAAGGAGVLVDTGLPLSGALIRRAAAERYGSGTRPEAIILTHGHFDHAGSALDLAKGWDMPIFAHPLEVPYLTDSPTNRRRTRRWAARSPRCTALLAQRLRLWRPGADVAGRRRRTRAGELALDSPAGLYARACLALPRDGRNAARGDALATMDMDSWTSQLTRGRELYRPPAPFTPDWEAARTSVKRLASLTPSVVAARHGLPRTNSM